MVQGGIIRLAHGLKAMGVKKGHKVMIILYRRIEFWVVSLALQRLGAVVVPAPPSLPPKTSPSGWTLENLTA
jgi:Acyl-coenzyme A synthetases/AMP-(fatty) acid ligases